MLTHSILILLCLGFGGPVAQAQPEQPPGGESGRPDREARRHGRGDRGEGPSEAERQQWRERQERYRKATPEERRQLRLEQWVEMTTRRYELSDEQQATVRKEMQTMAAERRAAMGPEADEYDRLRDQMFEMRAKQEPDAAQGEEGERRGRDMRQRMRDNPEFQKLQQRMEELDGKYPFDTDAARQRIEKLLPEEQVKKASAQREERRAQWQQRREERDRTRDDGRAERRGRPRDGGGPAARPVSPPAEGAKKPADDADKAKVEPDRAAAEAAKRTAEPQPPPPPPKSLHPWEKFVREFVARYELTEVQVASANAILRDSMNRAAQLETANASKIAGAEKIADRAAREARLKELNQPIEQLFEELKHRLSALLTAEQRVKKGDV